MVASINILSRHQLTNITKVSFSVENELKEMQAKICELNEEKIVIAKISSEIFILEMVKEKI